MIRFVTVAVAAMILALGSTARADDSLARPKKSLSLKRVTERQRDPSRSQLDGAVRLLKSGAYVDAAVALHRFLKANKKYRSEAQYNLAKALYRLGVYRSALHYFSGLLAMGPKNRFYRSSLEWCLFISRKMNDDDAVNEAVARYGTGEFPPEYRDEFSFRLARFHFARALAIERGELAGRPQAAQVEKTATGGKSIRGDVFGDLFGDEPAPGSEDAELAERARKRKAKRSKSGAISLDEDLFGDPSPPRPKKKKKAKKTRKKAASTAKKADPSAPWVLTSAEHTDAARSLVANVSRGSRFGPRAKFLQGVILYRDGKENDALAAFKDVVRTTRNADSNADPQLRQMAFFQLARTHFGAEQPSYSIAYYDKIDRDAYAWLDALFERSWAEFRLGNYERVLGNLLTLHAPFFDDQYYPESLILKAVVYYENCRYAEAKEILTAFLRRYEPVHDELKRLTSQRQSDEKYYETLGTLRRQVARDAERDEKGKQSATLAQVVTIALSDPELERLDRAYREAEAEVVDLSRIGGTFKGSGLSTELDGVMKGVTGALAQKAGRAVRNQLERERTAINELIQQAIRIDIETARSEQERIESQLRAVQRRPKAVQREFVEWTDDEGLVWPFEGEYWRDELGTYELTLSHSCR